MFFTVANEEASSQNPGQGQQQQQPQQIWVPVVVQQQHHPECNNVPIQSTTCPLPHQSVFNTPPPAETQNILGQIELNRRQVNQVDAIAEEASEVDLDEVNLLVQQFKNKRISLGLTQAQVGKDFEAIEGEAGGVAYSQSQICRIERLDITPNQAAQLKPLLEKWIELADQRYCYLSPNGSLVPVIYNKFVEDRAASSNGSKRQKRTVFSEEALEVLNKEFENCNTPNAFRMEEIAKSQGLEYKAVRIWFCNKRQALKKA